MRLPAAGLQPIEALQRVRSGLGRSAESKSAFLLYANPNLSKLATQLRIGRHLLQLLKVRWDSNYRIRSVGDSNGAKSISSRHFNNPANRASSKRIEKLKHVPAPEVAKKVPGCTESRIARGSDSADSIEASGSGVNRHPPATDRNLAEGSSLFDQWKDQGQLVLDPGSNDLQSCFRTKRAQIRTYPFRVKEWL